MRRIAALILTVAGLGGCFHTGGSDGAWLVAAGSGMVVGLNVWSDMKIANASAAEREEIRVVLLRLKPFTDAAALSVDAKLALIDSLNNPPLPE